MCSDFTTISEIQDPSPNPARFSLVTDSPELQPVLHALHVVGLVLAQASLTWQFQALEFTAPKRFYGKGARKSVYSEHVGDLTDSLC